MYKKRKKKVKITSVISLILLVVALILAVAIIIDNKDSEQEGGEKLSLETEENTDTKEVTENSQTSESTSESTTESTSESTSENDEMAEYLAFSFYNEALDERYINYKNDNPDLSVEQAIVFVNIGLDNEFYTNISIIDEPEAIDACSNKYNSLGEYKPDDLVKLPEKITNRSRDFYMREIAAEAFEKMVNDASLEGYEIKAMSTYRSYDYQKTLYNNYVAEDGVEGADIYSARAGHSEHQTGLVADIMGGDTSYNQFKNTKENEFILEKAHLYGFIVRYPEGKQHITGYKPEAWHIRYVGVELATLLKNEDLTLDEYWAIYK